MYPIRHKFIPLLLPFICLFSILGNDQNQRLYEHIKASPLSEFALTKDWPRYNGPSDDASSPETKLLKDWGKNGTTLVWE